MKDPVLIVDLIMGAGKTTSIIDGINENEHLNFIFVTQYLDEAERMINKTNLRQPLAKHGEGLKRNHFLKMVESKQDIVTTHSLFEKLRLEDYSLFADYVLIIDEVPNVVEPIRKTSYDINDLLSTGRLIIEGKDIVTWNDSAYAGEHSELRDKVMAGGVKIVNDSELIWTFPTEMFKAFKETVVLTYLFEGSLLYYYFQYNGIHFRKLEFQESLVQFEKKNISKLLDIYDGKYNNVGKTRGKTKPLSKSWYNKANKAQLASVTNACSNWFRHKSGADISAFRAFTTFKSYKDKIEGNAFGEFISVNQRATNKYRSKSALAYLVNYNLNPIVKNYFAQRNLTINEDLWSLSEMVQWIWRGCIRDGKEMSLFIPSFRMRNLLKKWLEN